VGVCKDQGAKRAISTPLTDLLCVQPWEGKKYIKAPSAHILLSEILAFLTVWPPTVNCQQTPLFFSLLFITTLPNPPKKEKKKFTVTKPDHPEPDLGVVQESFSCPYPQGEKSFVLFAPFFLDFLVLYFFLPRVCGSQTLLFFLCVLGCQGGFWQ